MGDSVQRQTGRPSKWDDEMVQFLLTYLGSHSGATLRDLRDQLVSHFGDSKPVVSTTSIQKTLDGKLITFKRSYTRVVNFNSPSRIQEREEYAAAVSAALHTLIYQDETGYSLWTHRRYGRASPGAAGDCPNPAFLRRTHHGVPVRHCPRGSCTCRRVSWSDDPRPLHRRDPRPDH